MHRDISKLTNNKFDLIIIGGGIFAACAAWDASLRGLSVALIEKQDFCSGSSANSFKFIHGGIRYLQHGDIIRLRSSCRERSAMLRIAPHLVQPMPVMIPTYGLGKSGKFFLGTGMLIYDLLTIGRNRGIKDAKRHINWTRFFNKEEVLKEYPDLDTDGLTGAAMFSDAQMYNPTRLVLTFLKSAINKGTTVANYVEAKGLIREGNTVIGIEAVDYLANQSISIYGKTVLNAAGSWSDWFLQANLTNQRDVKNTYSRDACFVIKRRFTSSYASAIQGRTSDPDALLSRPARHLFLVPWRDYTLVGVWHRVWKDHPDQVIVKEEEIQSFIDEINWAYPELKLTTNDVLMWNAGLVPFGDNEDGAENLSYGKRSLFTDHKSTDDLNNFVTMIGIRYTTARGDSAQAIDLICKKLGVSTAKADTENTPLIGGDISDFDQLVEDVFENQQFDLSKECILALTHNYGTRVHEILNLIARDESLRQSIGKTNVLKAEVNFAIENEMAINLSDIVFRRTDLATAGNPGTEALSDCTNHMATVLGWGDAESQKQLEFVLQRFPYWKNESTNQESIS